MGVIGREQIQNAIRVLQEEQGTLISMLPISAMQSVWLEGARTAIPYSDEPYRDRGQPHTRDTLQVARADFTPNNVTIEIGGGKVARFLYTGTVAHRIPLQGTAQPLLHFFWKKLGYEESWFSSVNHPGTTGQPWREEALTIARPGIVALAEVGMRNWVTRVKGRLT